jgi:hypothetical protein
VSRPRSCVAGRLDRLDWSCSHIHSCCHSLHNCCHSLHSCCHNYFQIANRTLAHCNRHMTHTLRRSHHTILLANTENYKTLKRSRISPADVPVMQVQLIMNLLDWRKWFPSLVRDETIVKRSRVGMEAAHPILVPLGDLPVEKGLQIELYWSLQSLRGRELTWRIFFPRLPGRRHLACYNEESEMQEMCQMTQVRTDRGNSVENRDDIIFSDRP